MFRLQDWTTGSPGVAVAMTMGVEQHGDQRLEGWRYGSAHLAACPTL